MYCLLLEREAKRLRNEPIIEPTKTHLELPVEGALPKRYISSDKHRMEAYRRISRAETLDELRRIAQSLREAYGEPPAPAQTLLDLAEIRLAAASLGIDAIKLEGPDLIFRSGAMARLQTVFDDARGRVSVIDETTIYYRPPGSYVESTDTLLAVLRNMLLRALEARAPERISA